MDSSQLEITLAVAREKSFSAAAQKLAYSQPTVSKRVDALEKELGLRLFDRKTRSRISLTPEGEQLLPLLDSAYGACNKVMLSAHELAETEDAMLRIGCTNGASTLGEDELIIRFASKHSNVTPEQIMGASYELITLLKQRLVDVILLPVVRLDEFPELRNGEFAYVPIREYRLRIAMSERHRNANAEAIRLADFQSDTFLFRKNRVDVQNDEKLNSFICACEQDGFEPKIHFISGRGSLLFGLIATGQYVAPIMYKPRTTRSDIVMRTFEKDYYHFKLMAFFPSDSDSTALASFVDFIQHTSKTPA